MSLQDQGFRYLIRAGQGVWVHPLDVQAGDIDCTDMTDEEFEHVVRESSPNVGG